MGNRDHWHDPAHPAHLEPGRRVRRHLGPEYLSYRGARLLLESSGRGANEAQNILDDLAHWPPGVKRFSFYADPYGLAWMAYAGTRGVTGEHWPQPCFYWRNDLPFHEHTWVSVLVRCDDCGEHEGVECEGCGEVLDLTYSDDPRGETG